MMNELDRLLKEIDLWINTLESLVSKGLDCGWALEGLDVAHLELDRYLEELESFHADMMDDGVYHGGIR